MEPGESPFVCSECKARGAEAKDCACGAGPMLDLRQQTTIDLLVEEDDRRREKQYQRFLWAGVVAGVLALVAALQFFPGVILAIPLPIPFANPIKFFALAIIVAIVTSKGLHAAFKVPYRFPELRG